MRILTPEVTLDEAAYQAYSPLYVSTTFGFSYALSFGGLTAVLTHTLLFYHKDLFTRFRTASNREDDVHARLYRKYPEVPDGWYYILFAIMMVLSIIVCEAWDTKLPWWGFLVTQLIPFIFTLPIGIVQAITNIGIGKVPAGCELTEGLNVITEFVAGYMFPGRPLANMMIKTYGYMTMSQGLDFVSDLKLGLYMKVPPRAMFRTQIWCTVLSYVPFSRSVLTSEGHS
jgi:OPT family oligopeptide transporter